MCDHVAVLKSHKSNYVVYVPSRTPNSFGKFYIVQKVSEVCVIKTTYEIDQLSWALQYFRIEIESNKHLNDYHESESPSTSLEAHDSKWCVFCYAPGVYKVVVDAVEVASEESSALARQIMYDYVERTYRAKSEGSYSAIKQAIESLGG